jgi:hypothetical protein
MASVVSPGRVGRGIVVILIVLALPIGLAGVSFGLLSITLRLPPRLRTFAFLLGAPIIFGIVAALLRRLSGPATNAIDFPANAPTAQAPAPWMARADWAAGEIHAGARAGVVIAWVVAIVWGLVSSPAALLMPQAIAAHGYGSLWLLVFPAAGICLLVWAARRTIRWRRYGESRFSLASLPGQVGGTLEGTLHIDRPPPASQPVNLKLTCIDRTRNAGDNSNIERIVWSDDSSAVSDGSGAIPVAFYIPEDCLPTDNSSSRDRIVWRLSATAPGAGVPYAAEFEVPIFKVKETAAQIAEAARVRARRDNDVEGHQEEPGSRIRITPAADGGTEIYFPAFRSPGPALFVGAFYVFWTVVLAVIHYGHAPLIFQIMWGFFDAILFLWMVSLWVGTTRVVVGDGEVTIHSGMLGVALRTRRVAAADIEVIRPDVGMTMGYTAYFRLQIRCQGGRTLNFGDGIPSRIEADWLADRMRERLGFEKRRALPMAAAG